MQLLNIWLYVSYLSYAVTYTIKFLSSWSSQGKTSYEKNVQNTQALGENDQILNKQVGLLYNVRWNVSLLRSERKVGIYMMREKIK